MYSHKCPSILALSAIHLATYKEVSAHHMTYKGLECPECKQRHRTTRFASTIHTLKHELGWGIKTHRTDGLQASYELLEVGQMPKGATPIDPHKPRWDCLVVKATPKGPGSRVSKDAIQHPITYPEQPSQKSTTDLSGRWAYGHCTTCSAFTVWQRVQ